MTTDASSIHAITDEQELREIVGSPVKPEQLPGSGAILRSLIGPEFDAEEYDRDRAERYARGEGLD
jgi:hypothetical protein